MWSWKKKKANTPSVDIASGIPEEVKVDVEKLKQDFLDNLNEGLTPEEIEILNTFNNGAFKNMTSATAKLSIYIKTDAGIPSQQYSSEFSRKIMAKDLLWMKERNIENLLMEVLDNSFYRWYTQEKNRFFTMYSDKDTKCYVWDREQISGISSDISIKESIFLAPSSEGILGRD